MDFGSSFLSIVLPERETQNMFKPFVLLLLVLFPAFYLIFNSCLSVIKVIFQG